MAAPQNFRSAFNGFNREDVVNYISYITNKQDTDLSDFKNQIRELEEEREALKAQVRQQLQSSVESERLRKELEQCRQELAEKDQLIARQEEDIASLVEAPAPVAKPAPIPTAVPAPAPQEASRSAQEELAAYRRAESTERRARERVSRMFDQACGTLADTSTRLEDRTKEMETLEQTILQNLADLQELIRGSQTELSDAAVAIGAIRPEEE